MKKMAKGTTNYMSFLSIRMLLSFGKQETQNKNNITSGLKSKNIEMMKVYLGKTDIKN
jgi:hypothetical protein